jgi:gluconate kinase
MKKIVILFGEMGAGKNYWGEFLRPYLDMPFFDGDTVATPEMAERVAKFQPLTPEIVSNYVQILAQETLIRVRQYPNQELMVGQALYLDEHRLFLQKFFQEKGYTVQFLWVKPPFWRNLRQIFSRKKGFLWAIYWLINRPFFQKPTHPCFLISS